MIFEFSWHWFEDYQPHILEGEDKTQEEFEEDCKRAMKESFDDYLSSLVGMWAGLPDWIEKAVSKMEDYGYKKADIMKFGYFGLYLPKTDRYCDENNKLSRIEYEKECPEFIEEIKRMIEHNDVIEKSND